MRPVDSDGPRRPAPSGSSSGRASDASECRVGPSEDRRRDQDLVGGRRSRARIRMDSVQPVQAPNRAAGAGPGVPTRKAGSRGQATPMRCADGRGHETDRDSGRPSAPRRRSPHRVLRLGCAGPWPVPARAEGPGKARPGQGDSDDSDKPGCGPTRTE